MLTILSRILNYGFKNFWRNGWLSTATVAIMLLALLVFGSLIMFRVTTEAAVTSIKDKIDISVYFKTQTSEDDILTVKRSLESLAEVSVVEYISREQALTRLKERHKEDVTVTQAISQLEENPLEASLNIKARQPQQYASIAQFLSAPRLTDYISKVNYFENKLVIDRLTFMLALISRGGLLLAIVLALIAGLVVFNTVRLAIYSNRDEIGVMRVVGASNIFVRGPFMVEGFLAGTIAALGSLIIMAPLFYFLSPYIGKLIPSLNISGYFFLHFFTFLGLQLLFGIVIGVSSSFIAVRRYLKN